MFTKWPPHSFIAPKRRHTSVYSQNKNYPASDQFSLATNFVGTLRKWRFIFLPGYFSLTKNSVSDRRKCE